MFDLTFTSCVLPTLINKSVMLLIKCIHFWQKYKIIPQLYVDNRVSYLINSVIFATWKNNAKTQARYTTSL